MSFDAPAAQGPAAPVMPAAPPPVMAPQGTKPKKKPQQATFLGGDMTPGGDGGTAMGASGNMGGKTLLGA